MSSSLARSVSLLLGCLIALFFTGQTSASELKEPYKIRIVLDVAKHRLLTSVFRQQVKRELHDGVQAALGKLASVTVLDTQDDKDAKVVTDAGLDPLLKEIRDSGLQKALDGLRERSDYKTHFVLIGLHGTSYEIQARQYDGTIQVPSPAVRREKTRDRDYVARAAALLMRLDIGLVGTIVSQPDATNQVKVEWKGGGLGVDLSNWLKAGEVLAIVNSQGGRLPTLPWTVLRLESSPKRGSSTCTLFSRYKLARTTGMRCILLGTKKDSSLRLRLVQMNRDGGIGELESGVGLQFRRRNFEGEDTTMFAVRPSLTQLNRDFDTSIYKDKGRFDRLVFVNVLSGDTVRARVPIPLIDDRIVTLPIPPVDEQTDDVLNNFRLLSRKVLDSSLVMADLFREINSLTGDPKRRLEALASVRKTLERSREEYPRLSEERDAVAAEIKKHKVKDPPSFQAIDSRLKQLRSAEADLLRHIALLEKIEKEENDPEKKDWLRQKERGAFLEKEGELGQAIAIYQKAPAKFQSAELKKHIADLEKQWKPANEEHAKAREFIFGVYPKLNTADLDARIKEATEHFEQCRKVSDIWGPLKLLKATELHIKRITEELAKLNPDVNADDEKPAKQIVELIPKIRKLDTDVRAYLDAKKPK